MECSRTRERIHSSGSPIKINKSRLIVCNCCCKLISASLINPSLGSCNHQNCCKSLVSIIKTGKIWLLFLSAAVNPWLSWILRSCLNQKSVFMIDKQNKSYKCNYHRFDCKLFLSKKSFLSSWNAFSFCYTFFRCFLFWSSLVWTHWWIYLQENSGFLLYKALNFGELFLRLSLFLLLSFSISSREKKEKIVKLLLCYDIFLNLCMIFLKKYWEKKWNHGLNHML